VKLPDDSLQTERQYVRQSPIPEGQVGSPGWVRDLRKRLALTQEELARTLNYGERQIRRWESGGQRPSARALEKLYALRDGKEIPRRGARKRRAWGRDPHDPIEEPVPVESVEEEPEEPPLTPWERDRIVAMVSSGQTYYGRGQEAALRALVTPPVDPDRMLKIALYWVGRDAWRRAQAAGWDEHSCRVMAFGPPTIW
jgi:DNA-binding transcriptional regulator YiaG